MELLALARERLPLPARLLAAGATCALTGAYLHAAVGYAVPEPAAATAKRPRKATPPLARRLAAALPVVALNALLPLLFAFSAEEANFRALFAFVVAWHSSFKAVGLAIGRGPLAERRWARRQFVALYCFPVFPRRAGAGGGGGGGGGASSTRPPRASPTQQQQKQQLRGQESATAAQKIHRYATSFFKPPPPRASAAGGRAADDAGGAAALAGGFLADLLVLLVASAAALALHAPADLSPRWLSQTPAGRRLAEFVATRVAPAAAAALPSRSETARRAIAFVASRSSSPSGARLARAAWLLADAAVLRSLRMLAAVAALFTWVRLSMNAMGAVAVALLGVRVAPPFDAPWRSRSLADFWGRRWNNSTGLLVRSVIFDAVLEGSAEAARPRYALVEEEEEAAAAAAAAAAARAEAAARADEAACGDGVVSSAEPTLAPQAVLNLLTLLPSVSNPDAAADGEDTIPTAPDPQQQQQQQQQQAPPPAEDGAGCRRPLGAAARAVAASATAAAAAAADARAVVRLPTNKLDKRALALGQQQQQQQPPKQQQQQQQQQPTAAPPPPPKARQACARLAAFVASAAMHDAMVAYVPGAPLGYWSAFMLVQVPLLLAQDALDARVTKWAMRGRRRNGAAAAGKQPAGTPAAAAAAVEPRWLRAGRVLVTWALLALTTHWLLWPPVIDLSDAVYRVIAGAHGLAERAAWPLLMAVGEAGAVAAAAAR